jgi:hypothetical protein
VRDPRPAALFYPPLVSFVLQTVVVFAPCPSFRARALMLCAQTDGAIPPVPVRVSRAVKAGDGDTGEGGGGGGLSRVHTVRGRSRSA